MCVCIERMNKSYFDFKTTEQNTMRSENQKKKKRKELCRISFYRHRTEKKEQQKTATAMQV